MRRLVARAAPLAAALLVACGGEEEEPATTSSGATGAVGSISVEAWATQAERICVEGDRAQRGIAARLFGDEQPTPAELEEFATTTVVPGLRAQRDALAALPKPESERETIDEMLSALGAGIEALSADPGALAEGADSVGAIREASELAADLGLDACGPS